MPDDSTVYSTKQIADRLGLGSAMVRKYAVCYEKLSGSEIPLKRRDGRQFSAEHYAVISHAKALVDGNQGLSVETALKMALGTAEISSDALTPAIDYGNAPELIDALTAAVARGNAELLAEVRQLRQDLLQSQTSVKEAPAADRQPDELQHGLIVRVAIRLERWLKRFRQ